jgi:hypothetical protein
MNGMEGGEGKPKKLTISEERRREVGRQEQGSRQENREGTAGKRWRGREKGREKERGREGGGNEPRSPNSSA